MSAQTAAMAVPPVRYSRPAIFLHWAIFLLVVLAFTAIEIRGPRGSDSRALWTGIHQWAGMSILCLSVLRIIWRGMHGAPAAEATNGYLVTLSARAVHGLLYVCLICSPCWAS